MKLKIYSWMSFPTFHHFYAFGMALTLFSFSNPTIRNLISHKHYLSYYISYHIQLSFFRPPCLMARPYEVLLRITSISPGTAGITAGTESVASSEPRYHEPSQVRIQGTPPPR